MKFTLIINTTDRAHQPADRALCFARALLAGGHQLVQVFFYADGVSAALGSCEQAAWSALSDQQDCELVLCSASADRLGLVDAPAGFEIAGLGALVEAGITSDRVISFG